MKDVKQTLTQQMKKVGLDDVEQLQDDMADLYVRAFFRLPFRIHSNRKRNPKFPADLALPASEQI